MRTVERHVVLLPHSFQNHALKVVVSLNHSILLRISLIMRNFGHTLNNLLQTVVKLDVVFLNRTLVGRIAYPHLRCETDNLVANILFKAHDNRHRHNHHRQTESYSDGGNTDCRTRNILPVLLSTIYFLCYEVFELHIYSTLPG